MSGALLLAILLWQAAAANEPPVAQPQAMRYERAIRVAKGEGQACAVLDATIFPHAASSLADLRIFPVGSSGAVHEVPYAITMSEAAMEQTDSARVLNLGTSGEKIVFDLEMPARAYTDVVLNLNPAVYDFIATATVTGLDSLSERGQATALGTFTLFDLSSQHLSRSTTLPLQESTFKFLHVALSFTSVPGVMVNDSEWFVPAIVGRLASVPPSREAQSIYTSVAETTTLTTKGRETVATFEIPARVPVERVSFAIAPQFKGNFSRAVRVSALTDATDDGGRKPLPENVSGNILRIHASEAGREIRTEQLAVPAILGANLQQPAKVEVRIENGDDQPLAIAAVRLQMRQREICFDASTSGLPKDDSGLALFYGDSDLAVPAYDYARLFVASRTALAAELGPETLNAIYRAPLPAARSFAERHPNALWSVLIATICALGFVAIRSAKNFG
jgi:hypothetical protein